MTLTKLYDEAARLHIDEVERTLRKRRKQLARDLAKISQGIRNGMTTQGALFAACAFGAAVEQSRHRRTWSLVTVLNAINAVSGIVITSSSMRVARTASASKLLDPSTV